MLKLGKEILLGQEVEYVAQYTKMVCRVVMSGKNKGFFTPTGFVKMKQRTEYKVVA